MLTLHSGAASCTIHPELGGSLSRWAIGDQPMLRTASAESIANRDLLGLSTFPLVPFSNRIAHGRFEWNGQRVQLTPNFAPEPHAIHGIGWERVWTVAALSDDTAILSLLHTGDASWPWPFEAEQRISIEGHRLTLALSVRNRAEHPAPLAFGHHPYFDATGASLQFSAEAVWMSGPDSLPTTPVAPEGQFDFTQPASVEGREVDHCYGGVSGAARISWLDRPLALVVTSSPQLEASVVYIPKDGHAFCFEPVPHINNALNLSGQRPQMLVVAAGDVFGTTITLQAVPQ
jgi:aldose 1-epimerase